MSSKMKKITTVFMSLFMAFCLICVSACNGGSDDTDTENDDPVVDGGDTDGGGTGGSETGDTGGSDEDEEEEGDWAFDKNSIDFTFSCMTDVHVGYGNDSTKFKTALQELKEYTNDGVELLLFGGDNTQWGTVEQVEEFKSIVTAEFDITEVPVVFCNGNHDVGSANGGLSTENMTTAGLVQAYGDDMYLFDVDQDILSTGNRHVKFKGYNFLAVQVDYFGTNKNTLSDETKEWLTQTLDSIVAEDPASYIFITCHSPASNTVFGSMDDDVRGVGVWGSSSELDDILKNYPQAILLSGHTHYAINLETSINQTTYTQINIGAGQNIGTEYDSLMNSSASLMQGLIFEVDTNNNIRITRMDYYQDTTIKTRWYLDAYQEDGSNLLRYNYDLREEANSSPVFNTQNIQISESSSTEIRVNFDAAEDDDMIYYYKVTAVDGNGTEIASSVVMSPFYDCPKLIGLPSSYSAVLTGNFGSVDSYTVNITAYDCYYAAAKISKDAEILTDSEYEALADEYDAQIALLSGNTLTADDLDGIMALKNELYELGYRVTSLMSHYDEFTALESQFCRTYCVSGLGMPGTGDVFTTAPTSSYAWASEGSQALTFNWKNATKNYFLGFSSAYSLDGLTLGLASPSFTSDTSQLGLYITGNSKEKYSSGAGLLLIIDFETGYIYNEDGAYIGASKYLVLDYLGGMTFEFKFALADDGSLEFYLVTPVATEQFSVSKSFLDNAQSLTDYDSCYISLSPWESKSTLTIDITGIS